MKVRIDASHIKLAIGLLFLLLLVKLLWFMAEVLILPVSGIDHVEEGRIKPLYYRVKLTPNKVSAPVIKQQRAPQSRIQDIKLLGIYRAPDKIVVTISYKNKTEILGKGESINGFVLEDAGSRYAIFSKDDKRYRVDLVDSKESTSGYKEIPSVEKNDKSAPEKPVGEVIDAGDHKIIDRSLIEHYAKNMKDIYKDIGIDEIKKGKKIDGFRVSFVKRGTPFSKLGLQRGDILKSINGQALNSYNAAFEAYKNINDATNVTLTIQRGNKEMELEYEIN